MPIRLTVTLGIVLVKGGIDMQTIEELIEEEAIHRILKVYHEKMANRKMKEIQKLINQKRKELLSPLSKQEPK